MIERVRLCLLMQIKVRYRLKLMGKNKSDFFAFMLVWACFSMRVQRYISFSFIFQSWAHQAFPSIFLLCAALSSICRLGFIDHHFHGCQFNFYSYAYMMMAHNIIQSSFCCCCCYCYCFCSHLCDVVHSSRLLNDDVERERAIEREEGSQCDAPEGLKWHDCT